MKEMPIAIFDLDGTITDPAEGITRSINYALIGLGYQPKPTKTLLKYIGSHLNITFSELTGRSDETTISRGIDLFRERYIPIGYQENSEMGLRAGGGITGGICYCRDTAGASGGCPADPPSGQRDTLTLPPCTVLVSVSSHILRAEGAPSS